MNSVLSSLMTLVFLFLVGNYSVPKIYKVVKYKSLEKIQRGVSPLTPLTEKMTGITLYK